MVWHAPATLPTAYEAAPRSRSVAPGKVGYVVPWGSAAAGLAADALAQGIRVHSVGGAFALNGRRYRIGTALIRNAGNPADLQTRLAALSASHGAEVVPIDTTFVDEGTSLGSNETRFLKAPRVLLAWDTPTQSLSAGWTRYTLERRFGQRVTAVRVSSLARADLTDFDVVVLPSGNYTGAVTDVVLGRLKDWLRGGGTIITLAEATRWATAENVGLLDTKPLLKNGNLDAPGDKPAAGMSKAGAAVKSAGPFDYDAAIQPERERPDAQPRAILRIIVDTEHWLSAGQDAESQTMTEGNRVFAPLKLNSGRNVGIYAAKDRLIASGLIWPENQDLLVQKAFLMHQPMGQGHVIAFAEDANYRAFSEATMLLFMNAVLLGPAY